MAEASLFSEMGSQIVSKITGGILWGGIALLVIGVLGFLGWYFFFYMKKFDIKVKVISQRAGDRNKIIFDKAAILWDRKTKTNFFRIWGLKLDLPSPKFNVLQSTNKGDYLELYRTSEDTIYFLTPTKIDKNRIIKADGKIYDINVQRNKMIDPDIAFWSVQRKKDNKKMFDTESLFMKLIPYIPQIMGGVLVIFVLYVLFDNLPSTLAQLTDLVKEMREARGCNIAQAIPAFLPLIIKWKKK